MDGVSDAPFRLMMATHGKPSLMMTEFTNVEGICHGNVKGLTAFLYSEIERPIVAQLFGTDPASFYKSTLVACALGFDGVDVNMGCPAKKVSERGAGAGLIKNPPLAKEILNQCQQAVKDFAEGKDPEDTDMHRDILKFIREHRPENFERKLIPVSVKTRIGISEIVIEEWVKHLLETKPVNITIHGRTLNQMYSGFADWEAIALAAKIIKQTPTTVLGNGDVQTRADALEKVKNFGLDGVLIGRASFGDPWIFTGEEKPHQEKLQAAVEHSKIYEQMFGNSHFVAMRKHLGWYCKGFPSAKELRMQLMATNNAAEVEAIVNEALKTLI
jgi:nifR3 family TIM-barrel protein